MEALKSGQPIYGSTTGYGPFVNFTASEDGGEDLIQHLLVGSGPSLPGNLVSAAIYLRAWTMAQGKSGVRLPVIQAYLAALKDCQLGRVPWIPSIGSLGASGDLVPLAHLLNSVLGRGARSHLANDRDSSYDAGDSDERISAQSLAETGASNKRNEAKNYLGDHTLDRREALACINGISFSKARASLTYCTLNRLLSIQEILTATLYVLLDANPEHLSPALFGSSTTSQCARRIRERVAELRKIERESGARGSEPSSGFRNESEKKGGLEEAAAGRRSSGRKGYALQAPYSLRCAPQTLGACLGVLASARSSLTQDLETIDDNPLIDPDTGISHGGNFFGQATAFGADELTMLACQAGVLAERQLALLLDPEINGEESLMLAGVPGQSSGLAGLQLTATAVLAEMRSLSHMHSTYSIPTNGKNQDIVPMAFLAARRATEVSHHLATLLGALLMASRRLWESRVHRSGRSQPFPFWSRISSTEANASFDFDLTSGPSLQPEGSLGKELLNIQRAFLGGGILSNENLYS
tara:strand:+ start:278931 stop:280511 length:1581 start_codon:yes stop_codon:yes gene_type:complete